MKNKLLLTSALVGVLASSAAVAETKISGNMTLGYKAMSNTTVAGSSDGFGRETQINVTKTGDLNNGLKYAAGFAFEFDGGQSTDASNENVHFNVISGNTTVGFGMDNAPNTSQSAAPRVAEHADTTFAGGTVTTFNMYDYHAGSDVKEAFAVTLIQKAAIGQFSASYIPSVGDTGGADSGTGSSNATNGNSAYNIIYKGDAGVKGLTIIGAYQKEEQYAGDTDIKVKQAGVGYNFGRFALGVQMNDQNSNADVEQKSYEYGATVALSDEISAGLIYIKTDREGTVEDEKITIAQLGYNMGPATVSFSYGTTENANGSATVTDVDVASVRLSTSF